MLAIYVATSFVIWMIFRLVSELIDKVKLESFDRQLGGMIGFAKGVLLCVAITFFAVTLLPQQQGEAIVASRAGRTIVVLLNKAHDVVPQELNQVIDPYLNKIEERISGNAAAPERRSPRSMAGRSTAAEWAATRTANRTRGLATTSRVAVAAATAAGAIGVAGDGQQPGADRMAGKRRRRAVGNRRLSHD